MSEEKIKEQAHPDWRDASDYAYTKRMTRDDWAGEFLRRNRAYEQRRTSCRCQKHDPENLRTESR
jgi:Family of unknown function (DUF6499)